VALDFQSLEFPKASLLLGICHVTRTVPIRRITPRWKQRKPVAARPKTLGEHLKKARVDKGLTLKQLGQLLGVHYRSVYGWENGQHAPKPSQIDAIAAFLGYKPTPKYRKTLKGATVGNLPPANGVSSTTF